MKKQVQVTGDHGLGQMVHVVHMADDAQKLREFYERVFGGFVYMGVDEPNYLPVEDRYATLLMVSDLCIETMAPAMPVDTSLPVGKFFDKFGTHLHSVGYKVDDLPGLVGRLIGKGIYIGRPGGGRVETAGPGLGYCFPSPRDTYGLMVELTEHDMPGDPRDLETWSSLQRMWLTHPLTIERFSYVTLGVKDLDKAVETYVDEFQAVPVKHGDDPDLQARYATLQLGDCLLELAQPLSADSDLGRHVAQWGNMIYSLRFKVVDLDSAEAWLTRQGVRSRRIREGLLMTDPQDSFNAPIFLGTEEIEGDPFGE
ncbi:VOC family protein [Trujillonella humicola]|uniref:VOC family protein n=1 Tax=Trujillonella humicola TaxID=3383699 RepID=UPI0039059047